MGLLCPEEEDLFGDGTRDHGGGVPGGIMLSSEESEPVCLGERRTS